MLQEEMVYEYLYDQIVTYLVYHVSGFEIYRVFLNTDITRCLYWFVRAYCGGNINFGIALTAYALHEIDSVLVL